MLSQAVEAEQLAAGGVNGANSSPLSSSLSAMREAHDSGRPVPRPTNSRWSYIPSESSPCEAAGGGYNARISTSP